MSYVGPHKDRNARMCVSGFKVQPPACSTAFNMNVFISVNMQTVVN